MLTEEQFNKWVEALRSNTYLQGRYTLKRGNCFCVLGVCADVNKKDFGVRWRKDLSSQDEELVMSSPHGEHIDFSFSTRLPANLIPMVEQNSLIKLNDQFCLSLPELADYLERNKTAFTESAPPSNFP